MPQARAIATFALASLAAGVVAAGIAFPFVGGSAAAANVAVQGFQSLPQRMVSPDLPQSSVLLARDGSTLATLYNQNRLTIPLTAVAPVMRQAIVATEDSRFYEHRGVDLRGTTRAILTTYLRGGDVQGGSTITQQYVKNVLVETARTPEEAAAARAVTSTRKIREMRLALALERRLSKDEILERYLNIAYFGAKAYGVEAASRRFFSKSAADLTLPEAATLAGLVQSPGTWDPLRNPDATEKRRALVLSRMVANGFITSKQARTAGAVKISSLLKPSNADNGCVTSWAPFFCDYVVQLIRTNPIFGATLDAREQLLRQGGLVIRTTLDPQAQRSADKAVRDYIPAADPSGKAAAITMLQPGTGDVIAMAQNRDWGSANEAGKTALNYNVGREYNGIIGAQAGSTFKAFTIAAALQNKYDPWKRVASPPKKTFTGFRNCQTGVPFEPYTVQNSTRSGTFNMFTATAYSVNTYFVELEMEVGLCDPVAVAQALGMKQGDGKELESVPSFTLGVSPVTPMSMAESFATFAAHGVHCVPHAIVSITNRVGQTLRTPSRTCKRALTREVADGTTLMLRGVVDGSIPGRTGARMALNRESAGKTGTTNENAAVWFVGFTPELAAAVWVGDPRGGQKYPLQNIKINGRFYKQVFGGTMPGPIWKQAMLGALEGTTPQRFDLKLALRPTTTTPVPATQTPTPVRTITLSPRPTRTITIRPSSTAPGTTLPPSGGSELPQPSSSTVTITITPTATASKTTVRPSPSATSSSP